MTTLIDHASDQGPVIIMTRTLDAPREMVWRVFTQPEHIVRWWGGQGFTNPVCEMDLRPGGLWRHVMRTPDGTEMAFDFVFSEIEPPSRLAWREVGPRRPGGPPSVLQTITLEALGERRTRWTLVARADSFADRDAAVRSGYSTIITQSLDRLSTYLTTL